MPVPSTLVDPTTLSQFSQADTSSYSTTYLGNICLVAHKICAAYLTYDPAVQVHSGEIGQVSLNKTGRNAGATEFRLAHQPLLTDDPSQVFTALVLRFSVAVPDQDIMAMIAQATSPTDVVRVTPASGRTYVAWMGLGTLYSVGFQYGAGSASGASLITGATQYKATYTAGYAITTADQSAYPTAPACPVDMRLGCAQLVEILLGQAGRIAENVQNAVSGVLQSFKNVDYEERYHQIEVPNSVLSLLYGSQQGVWARQNLTSYIRTSGERILLL